MKSLSSLLLREENLWNAWISISDLRDSVTKKRHRLQLLRQKLKLASILKAQIVFLEDWAYLDKDHSILLFGAIEALNASTLRLPLGAGASAGLQSIKDAIFKEVHLELCLQQGETHQQTDSDFLESGKDTFRDDGSTASTAVLVGNVANVGDSQTVISKAGKGSKAG